jgi:hypothetical protein
MKEFMIYLTILTTPAIPVPLLSWLAIDHKENEDDT